MIQFFFALSHSRVQDKKTQQFVGLILIRFQDERNHETISPLFWIFIPEGLPEISRSRQSPVHRKSDQEIER